MKSINNDISDTVIEQFDKYHQQAILRSKDTLSSWLSALPIQKDHFDLTANEFRDALCLRYMKPILQLPPFCDGCSAPFTTTHTLDCRKGGLVSQRHNEIRDLLCDLSSMAWSNVTKEPVVTEPSSDSSGGGLIADFAVHGIWQCQSTALFDVRITDSDSPSYADKPPFDVLLSAKREKKRKCMYAATCELRYSSFTPLCLTIDCLMGREMRFYLQCLADCLTTIWELPYSLTMFWLRTRLSFALLWATSLCIRSSRTRWKGLGMEDGSGINPVYL